MVYPLPPLPQRLTLAHSPTSRKCSLQHGRGTFKWAADGYIPGAYINMSAPPITLPWQLFSSPPFPPRSSPHSRMDSCNEPDVPSIAPEDLIPTPAAEEDKVRSPTPPLVHFVLGNFALAMLLISLIIFVVFFVVAWLTVLRDARSMRDQVLSNATGVSISPLQRVCFTNGRRRGRYQCSATSSSWTSMHTCYPFHGWSSSAVHAPPLGFHSGVTPISLWSVNRLMEHSTYTSTSTSKFIDGSITGVEVYLCRSHIS